MHPIIKAIILDLDGVVTDTAEIHCKAWKQLFDEYLEKRCFQNLPLFRPFDPSQDYLLFIDGKSRLDGVDSFLASRGIRLPPGGIGDSSNIETVWGMGARKNEIFQALLKRKGPTVFSDAIDAIDYWKKNRLKIAIASSSKNCKMILEIIGIEALFDIKVDGNFIQEKKLAGKPAPDLFLATAAQLGIPPSEAAVIEDSVAGIQAGRTGAFGRVIGISRSGHASKELQEAGADFVVSKLTEIKMQSGYLQFEDSKPARESISPKESGMDLP